jgi:hypothetical protein
VVLGNSKTNGVREPLSQRTSGNFNAVSVVRLGVTGCDAVYRLSYRLDFESTKRKVGWSNTDSECLDIVQRKLVSAEMEESILKHATMAVAVRSSVE